MEKSIVKRWVKALRSGKYKQGQARLKDKNGNMCCLGVLCDVTQKETGGEWNGTRFQKDHVSGARCLPSFVVDELDMPEGNSGGQLKRKYKLKGKRGNGENYHDGLFMLNDRGYTFKQIANIIEKNF